MDWSMLWSWDKPASADADLTMNRRALACGCLWRAIGWSLLAGVLLGAGHAGLVHIWFNASHVAASDMAIGFFLQWLGLALTIGVWHGATLGLLAGLGLGLALAALVIGGFSPLRRVRPYQRVARAAGVVAFLVSVWLVHQVIRTPGLVLVGGPTGFAIELAAAGLIGWWVGGRVERWSISETLGLVHG